MFLGSSRESTTFDSIKQAWTRLAPISSHQAFFNSENDGFLHPGCVFLSRTFRQDTPIVIDTGASSSLSPFKEDFVSFTPTRSTVTGIGSKSEVLGYGTVRWAIYDQNQRKITIETKALYMPAANIRLYSPQAHFQANNSGCLFMDHKQIKIQFPTTTNSLSFPYHGGCNLPLMLLQRSEANSVIDYINDGQIEPFCYLTDNIETLEPKQFDIFSTATSSAEILDHVTDERNANLTGPQHELLAWHYRWGHISMSTIQRPTRSKDRSVDVVDHELPKTTVIRSKFQTTHSCRLPQCASCNLAKAERTSIRTKTTSPSSDGSIKASHLRPGDCVSMDQIVCPQKGRTLSSAKAKISGGTIYVDHASGWIKFVPQEGYAALETLQGKAELEREAHELGIRIKSYVTDNGIFKSRAFRHDFLRKNQKVHFCGVGAKHQNGVAERAIKTICNLSRAMLIHAALRWPDSHDIALWTLCLQHAVFVWNRIPSADGLSPEEKWTSTKSDHHQLRSLHPWGCPAYVLDPTLQDGKKIPKWKPRSRQGRFVGHSQTHASSVTLILNRQTKFISPQFHILFDDFFSTVKGVDSKTQTSGKILRRG